VGAGTLTTNGAVKVTSTAPDAARTLAGDGLANRSDDSTACAPNHAAGGGGSRAGGRGFGGRHANSTSAARGVGASAPCARAGACGSGDRSIYALTISAGRGCGAQVDARLLHELRDRREPSPGACAIGAEVGRAPITRARPWCRWRCRRRARRRAQQNTQSRCPTSQCAARSS
jgi:hypothetical protein